MKFKGKVWRFGDLIDTDVIIPARYLNVSDSEELAKSCFSDVRAGFSEAVQPGDIIVAGANFGCGSSREHAPRAIMAAGISVIIAGSFARIFYRNAFNIGLPILELPGAIERLEEGDLLTVDLVSGEITRPKDGLILQANPVPGFMRGIIEAGGLVPHIKRGVE